MEATIAAISPAPLATISVSLPPSPRSLPSSRLFHRVLRSRSTFNGSLLHRSWEFFGKQSICCSAGESQAIGLVWKPTMKTYKLAHSRVNDRSSRRWLRMQATRCMAPDEEKMTKRSPLDFPVEWDRPSPGRRPDIFPQFSPMKTPLPQPLPADPPEEDEEEEEKKEEEEEEPDKEPEKPEE